jgi:hypothetical protein
MGTLTEKSYFCHTYINVFFLIIKILIHSIISSSWVCIHEGKLLGCQLQARDVINKPNLDVILHSDLGYIDFSRLCTLDDYLS